VRCGAKISSLRLSPFSWHLQISLGSPLDPAKEDLFASVFLARRSLEAQKPSHAEPLSLAGWWLDFSLSVPSRLTARFYASGYPGSKVAASVFDVVGFLGTGIVSSLF